MDIQLNSDMSINSISKMAKTLRSTAVVRESIVASERILTSKDVNNFQREMSSEGSSVQERGVSHNSRFEHLEKNSSRQLVESQENQDTRRDN